MKLETISKIKALLTELEQDTIERAQDRRALVSGLELPGIIRDVVDLLFPELRPYEAALYMYMLRHSIAHTGDELLRVSRRGLQEGVIRSPTSGTRAGGREPDSSGASYETIRVALVGLEALGAIRQEAEPNRDGTLYRVLLPEEIEICKQARALKSDKRTEAADETQNLDFYNVRENRIKVYERDGYECRYCRKQLTRFTATLDHVQSVAEGGNNSLENLVTACLDCNSRKNRRLVGDFLASERGE